jgi:hypothetical protein
MHLQRADRRKLDRPQRTNRPIRSLESEVPPGDLPAVWSKTGPEAGRLSAAAAPPEPAPPADKPAPPADKPAPRKPRTAAGSGKPRDRSEAR